MVWDTCWRTGQIPAVVVLTVPERAVLAQERVGGQRYHMKVGPRFPFDEVDSPLYLSHSHTATEDASPRRKTCAPLNRSHRLHIDYCWRAHRNHLRSRLRSQHTHGGRRASSDCPSRSVAGRATPDLHRGTRFRCREAPSHTSRLLHEMRIHSVVMAKGAQKEAVVVEAAIGAVVELPDLRRKTQRGPNGVVWSSALHRWSLRCRHRGSRIE